MPTCAPRPRLFAVVLAPFALALALAACHRGEPTTARAPTPVRVRTVEQKTEAGGARYSGSIEPATRVDLAFKVGGYVRDLAQVKGEGPPHKLQEGDWVKAGAVLAQVREADYDQKLAAANAAFAEASAAQKQAQLDFDRATKLAAQASISKAESDAMGARLEAAAARVEGAKARIAEARLALSDCTLRAPMDGVVLKRGVEVGTLVAPGTVAFILADTRAVKVVFGAPDKLVEKLRIGSDVAITVEAVQGDFAAKVTRVAPSADLKSRVFDVEATIPNPTDRLKAGMIASLKVTGTQGASAAPALVLPLTAVLRSPRDPRGFSVFVVDGEVGHEVVHLRDVKLGDVLGNAVFVEGGLKDGERVVAMGASLVTDGERIRVIP